MGRIVIVGYKPLPGKQNELEALAKTHHARLAEQGLVTDRQPVLMRARDGTLVEVFEWLSEAAMASAHDNPQIVAMWQEYTACCTYVPLVDLPEFSDMFAAFTPIDG